MRNEPRYHVGERAAREWQLESDFSDYGPLGLFILYDSLVIIGMKNPGRGR